MSVVPERKVAVLVLVEVEPPEARKRKESGFRDAVVVREDEVRIRIGLTGSDLISGGRTHFRFGLSGPCTFPD